MGSAGEGRTFIPGDDEWFALMGTSQAKGVAALVLGSRSPAHYSPPRPPTPGADVRELESVITWAEGGNEEADEWGSEEVSYAFYADGADCGDRL